MFQLGLVLGIVIGAVAATIVAMMFIVIGGLTRAGEHQTRWEELWRSHRGERWENAGVRREAQRLNAVDSERQRLSAREQASAQR